MVTCGECGGAVVPALVELCVTGDHLGEVLSVFAAGVDPRFTEARLDAMRSTRETFAAAVGIDRFDQAVAGMRDELERLEVRPDELFPVLEGAALLLKLRAQYAEEVPAGTDADAYAFGVLAALVVERLPR